MICPSLLSTLVLQLTRPPKSGGQLSGRKHDALRLAHKTVGALDTYVADVPTDTAAAAAAAAAAAIVAATCTTTINMPTTIIVAATTITSGYLQEPNLADAKLGTPIRSCFPRPARAASFGAAR